MSSNGSTPGSPRWSKRSSGSLFLSSRYMAVGSANGESQSQSQSEFQSKAQNEAIVDLSEPWNPSYAFSPDTLGSQAQPQAQSRGQKEPLVDLSEPWNPSSHFSCDTSSSRSQAQSRVQNKPLVDLSEPWDPPTPFLLTQWALRSQSQAQSRTQNRQLVTSSEIWDATHPHSPSRQVMSSEIPYPAPPALSTRRPGDDDNDDNDGLFLSSKYMKPVTLNPNTQSPWNLTNRAELHTTRLASLHIEEHPRQNTTIGLALSTSGPSTSKRLTAAEADNDADFINTVVDRIYTSLKLENRPALSHFETADNTLDDELLGNIPVEGDAEFLEITAMHWWGVMCRARHEGRSRRDE
ncbi:hypothetical protein NPX13_g3830 [Xylaria arbuscula]|uniref:Uncharacterized protein n=1 Tax=Xylaria arbuscula TaxID=114810 RepID=A0A9W8NGK4_9PEZI|nr:hypothetical protein NPX13_g3830 [Xylaria arbuscula]